LFQRRIADPQAQGGIFGLERHDFAIIYDLIRLNYSNIGDLGDLRGFTQEPKSHHG
jgi:hypothetical protein